MPSRSCLSALGFSSTYIPQIGSFAMKYIKSGMNITTRVYNRKGSFEPRDKTRKNTSPILGCEFLFRIFLCIMTYMRCSKKTSQNCQILKSMVCCQLVLCSTHKISLHPCLFQV